MDSQLEQASDNAAWDYFHNKIRSINNIYIDLETMQDFQFGALINLITTNAEYDYILYRIKEYSKRLDADVMKYFPVITDVTDDDISNYIANPDNHRRLVVSSPTTDFYMSIPSLLATALEQNKRAPHDRVDIVVHIGTNSVIMDQDLKKNIIKLFTKFDPNIEVRIYNRPLADMEPETIASMDMVIINNIEDFVSTDIIKNCLSESVFFNKFILAFPYISEEYETLEQKTEALNNNKVFLDVYCDFNYIERGITI